MVLVLYRCDRAWPLSFWKALFVPLAPCPVQRLPRLPWQPASARLPVIQVVAEAAHKEGQLLQLGEVPKTDGRQSLHSRWHASHKAIIPDGYARRTRTFPRWDLAAWRTCTA
jgi:hypothetical protein